MKFLLYLLFTLPFTSYSQHIKKENEHNTWLTYQGNHVISKKIGFLTEFNWRRYNGFSAPIQNEIKLGVNYKTNTFTLGWAHIENFSYGELSKKHKRKYLQ